MPRIIEQEELNAIRKVVEQFADGLSVGAIAEKLKLPIERRTLQRRLQQLTREGVITKSGTRRGLRYAPKDRPQQLTSPTVNKKESGSGGLSIDVSTNARKIFQAVNQPIQRRRRVGYNRQFLDGYTANKTFYLTANMRAHLEEIGKPEKEGQPIGTYARQILDRLLIDLSFHSSRLEGNTYSLLETKRLIEHGKTAEGHSAQETQMILNHKRAIEFLVESAEQIGIDRRSILNLHAILSDNLLGDPAGSGRIRKGPVEIGSSVYTPLAIPQVIEECFQQIVNVVAKVENPFEQSFFLLVHLPYLQPFDDVNKRVSRLAANIPLFRHNLRPLSFTDVTKEDYVAGLLGVYELNKIDLIRDLYMWAYERSAAQYAIIRESLGAPDEFRLRYRSEIKLVVADVVRSRMPAGPTKEFVEKWAKKNINELDQPRFVAVVESELVGLHEGNFARYPITPNEFEAWQALEPNHQKSS